MKIKQETLNKEILDEYCPFKPTLNEQSALLKREGNINQRLFEISKEKAKEILVLEEKPKIINPESESLVFDKFLKEFSGIFPKNTADEENFYDFAEFLNLLEKIHFVHFSPHKDEEVLATKA